MAKRILGLPTVPCFEYGKGGFSWRNNIPSAAYTGQRWFPSMNHLGAPLLGRVVYTEKKFRGIAMPPRLESVLIFLEMLEVVEVSGEWRQLLGAAVYRRQVTERECKAIDDPLLQLACRARPKFNRGEWELLAERMPPNTRIRTVLSAIASHPNLSRTGNVQKVLSIAAE